VTTWRIWQWLPKRQVMADYNNGREIIDGSHLTHLSVWSEDTWEILVWTDHIRILKERSYEERLTIMVRG
jgi:hypothetical protein